MEQKSSCPRCGTILTLQDSKGGNKQFVCACGDKSPVYRKIKGKRVIYKREPRVRIKCPFCGKEHHHGETKKKPLPALRRSHCLDPTETGEAYEKLMKRYPKAWEGGTYYVYVDG